MGFPRALIIFKRANARLKTLPGGHKEWQDRWLFLGLNSKIARRLAQLQSQIGLTALKWSVARKSEIGFSLRQRDKKWALHMGCEANRVHLEFAAKMDAALQLMNGKRR